jgi:hypothetical protein
MLRKAAAVFGDRRRRYGRAAELFDAIARRWSVTLGISVTPAQVALCMIDVKVARLGHDPRNSDSVVDVAGYAACLHEIARGDRR